MINPDIYACKYYLVGNPVCKFYLTYTIYFPFSLGRPGVDAHAKHEGESECAVLFAQFLVNEGALVTVTADDTIHLWNIRQKTPLIVQSLKFQRERYQL